VHTPCAAVEQQRFRSATRWAALLLALPLPPAPADAQA